MRLEYQHHNFNYYDVQENWICRNREVSDCYGRGRRCRRREWEKAIALELARFGVSESDLPLLLATAQAMKPTDELLIVNNMNDEQKKYVAAFLGTLMAVDGEIAEDEMKLWRLTSTLCSLPTMNVAEAIQYMTNM